jgi:hypothetical protein
MADEQKVLQCVRIETDDMPFLVGELHEVPELLSMIFGDMEPIPDGATVTLTFQRMTEAQYAALPDWGP